MDDNNSSTKVIIKGLMFFVMIANVTSLHHVGHMVDEEHLLKYPYCGDINLPDTTESASRVVNAQDSKIKYPWLVYLVRTTSFIDTKLDAMVSYCTGSVITDR